MRFQKFDRKLELYEEGYSCGRQSHLAVNQNVNTKRHSPIKECTMLQVWKYKMPQFASYSLVSSRRLPFRTHRTQLFQQRSPSKQKSRNLHRTGNAQLRRSWDHEWTSASRLPEEWQLIETTEFSNIEFSGINWRIIVDMATLNLSIIVCHKKKKENPKFANGTDERRFSLHDYPIISLSFMYFIKRTASHTNSVIK